MYMMSCLDTPPPFICFCPSPVLVPLWVNGSNNVCAHTLRARFTLCVCLSPAVLLCYCTAAVSVYGRLVERVRKFHCFATRNGAGLEGGATAAAPAWHRSHSSDTRSWQQVRWFRNSGNLWSPLSSHTAPLWCHEGVVISLSLLVGVCVRDFFFSYGLT